MGCSLSSCPCERKIQLSSERLLQSSLQLRVGTAPARAWCTTRTTGIPGTGRHLGILWVHGAQHCTCEESASRIGWPKLSSRQVWRGPVAVFRVFFSRRCSPQRISRGKCRELGKRPVIPHFARSPVAFSHHCGRKYVCRNLP